jgi:hypothetical protein
MGQQPQFRTIASGGLGEPANTTAHSMVFHRGCLYVGTTNPAGSGREGPPRLMRFDPASGKWDKVYSPPLVPADERAYAQDIQVMARGGRMAEFMRSRRPPLGNVPRDFGYRSMTLFQGKSDPEPAIYTSSLSLWGSVILRSSDGQTFEEVCDPGFGNDTILSFRGLRGFRGRLFASPAGTIDGGWLDRNNAPEAVIYSTDDPASGRWVLSSAPAFGDRRNAAIYSVCAAHGFLYAGTCNPQAGFQVWRTAAEGDPPFDWEPVILNGAHRFNLNMAAAAMVEFQGSLYVGGGIPGFGYDRANDVGPSAGELIRINPDRSWDLLFGEPRFTPDGLKVPISAMGPGLDDPYNSVVWSMAVHGDRLYLGTHQWEPFDILKNPAGRELKGGYQLWSTPDGEQWDLLITDGNGDCGATGLRTLLSTPVGLFGGTANHRPLLRRLGGLRGASSRFDLDGEGGFSIFLATTVSGLAGAEPSDALASIP